MPDFVPQVAPVNTSLAETLLNAGNQRAAIQARMFGDVGNTISQIPGQIQGQAAQRQQMALEAAKAQREQTLADLQQKSFDYATDQRAKATAFLSSGALKNFDPETIVQRATAAGMDAETTAGLLKTGATIRDSTLDTFNQQQKHLAEFNKALYPVVGTPVEQPVLATLVDSARQQEKLGIIPQGSVDTFMKNWQSAGNDLIAKKALLTHGIMSSPEVAKAAQDDIFKITPLSEGQKAFVGLGVGGGGGAGQPVAQAGYKPGSFEATLQADHPGVDISTLPSKVVEAAHAQFEAGSKDPLERAVQNATLTKLQRENAGLPGSDRHNAAVKPLESALTAVETPARTIGTQASDIITDLNSGDRALQSAAVIKFGQMASGIAGRGIMPVVDALKNDTSYMNTVGAWTSKVLGGERPPITQEIIDQQIKAARLVQKQAQEKLDVVQGAREKASKTDADHIPEVINDFHKAANQAALHPPGQSGAVTVNIPGKGMHTFPSQEDADAVLKVANAR